MNIENQSKMIIHSLHKFEPGEEIISILEDLANDDRDIVKDRKPRSIKDKLRVLGDRYDPPQKNLNKLQIKIPQF